MNPTTAFPRYQPSQTAQDIVLQAQATVIDEFLEAGISLCDLAPLACTHPIYIARNQRFLRAAAAYRFVMALRA